MIIQDTNIIENPLASVVIFTYNQEKTISQTVESVLQQRCDYPFEIIIAEDCGTDGTRQICIDFQKRFPKLIRLLLQDTNQRVIRNYYDGLSLCRGKYIAQCAGDDYWHHPGKLQMQIDFLEKHPDYGIVHTDYNLLDSKTGKITANKKQIDHEKISEGYILKELFYGYNLIAITLCFRKDLFFKHVPYADFIKMNFLMEDLPSFVIMAKYCKVGYLPSSTATYRKHHTSATNQTDAKVAENFYNSVAAVNRYLCNLFPEELKYDERYQRIHKNTGILTAAYKSRNFSYARKYGDLLSKDGIQSKMITFSKNRVLFYLFYFLKKMQR